MGSSPTAWPIRSGSAPTGYPRRGALIELDEDLLARAKRALGQRTTRAVVETALRQAAERAEGDGAERATRQRRYLASLASRTDPALLAFGRDVALTGWVLDKSAAARAGDPEIGRQLEDLAGALVVCAVGELEQLYSARSAQDYDRLQADLRAAFELVTAPPDLLTRALALQRDLAHHHGMWHRTPIADLLIAETALHHGLGVVHVDGHYDRIGEVRSLVHRRLTVDPGR